MPVVRLRFPWSAGLVSQAPLWSSSVAFTHGLAYQFSLLDQVHDHPLLPELWRNPLDG